MPSADPRFLLVELAKEGKWQDLACCLDILIKCMNKNDSLSIFSKEEVEAFGSVMKILTVPDEEGDPLVSTFPLKTEDIARIFNTQDDQGYTFMHYVLEKGGIESLDNVSSHQVLSYFNYLSLSVANCKGQTVLHFCLRDHYLLYQLHFVDMICSRADEMLKGSCFSQDSDGFIPLDYWLQSHLQSLPEITNEGSKINLTAINPGQEFICSRIRVKGAMQYKGKAISKIKIRMMKEMTDEADMQGDILYESDAVKSIGNIVITTTSPTVQHFFPLDHNQCVMFDKLKQHCPKIFDEIVCGDLEDSCPVHFWDSIRDVYKDREITALYTSLHENLAMKIVQLAQDENKREIQIVFAGCAVGDDASKVVQAACTANMKVCIIGFDSNSHLIQEAQAREMRGVKFVVGNMMDIEKIWSKNLSPAAHASNALKIAVFSGTLTRDVIRGMLEAIKILQRTLRCVHMTLIVGYADILVIKYFAKKCGWNVECQNLDCCSRQIKPMFVLIKMQPEERLAWLLKKLNKHPLLLDLSFSADPIGDLQLLKRSDAAKKVLAKVQVVDLRNAYLKETEVGALSILLLQFAWRHELKKIACTAKDVIDAHKNDVMFEFKDIVVPYGNSIDRELAPRLSPVVV